MVFFRFRIYFLISYTSLDCTQKHVKYYTSVCSLIYPIYSAYHRFLNSLIYIHIFIWTIVLYTHAIYTREGNRKYLDSAIIDIKRYTFHPVYLPHQQQ